MAEERTRTEEPDLELDPRPTAEIDQMRSPDLPEQRNSRLAFLVLFAAIVIAALVIFFGFGEGRRDAADTRAPTQSTAPR